jgi:Cysteine rich repeat
MKRISMVFAVGLVAGVFMQSATADVRSACAEDVKTLCPNMKPGGGRVAACLKENKDKVSSACKDAIKEKAKERESAKAS